MGQVAYVGWPLDQCVETQPSMSMEELDMCVPVHFFMHACADTGAVVSPRLSCSIAVHM